MGEFFSFCMGIIFGCVLGGWVLIISTDVSLKDVRTKAIENHCAEYVVTDSLKGTIQFKWNNEINK